MVGFMFVNVDHPSQLSNTKSRRLVRSHISKFQHEQKRSALELELQAKGRNDDGTSRSPHHDHSISSLPVTSISTPTETSRRKSEHTATTIDAPATSDEPDLSRTEPIGGFPTRHNWTCIDCGANPEDLRPPCHSCVGSSGERLGNYEQQQKGPVMPDESRRDFKEEDKVFSKWHETGAESPKHVSPFVSKTITTTKSKSKSKSKPRSFDNAFEHSSAPPIRVRFPLDDPGDELQIFARRLRINVITLLRHYYKVFDTMSAQREPQYNLPPGVLHSLWDTSMRVDLAARAAIVFSAATNFCFTQSSPFHANALPMLRGYALSHIRAALDNPKRCTSDAVLVAVVTVAQTAMMCGQREEYAVHSRGFAKIRQMRGGAGAEGRTFDRALECIMDLTPPQVWDHAMIACSERDEVMNARRSGV